VSTDVDQAGGPEVRGPFGAPVPADEAPATLRANELNLFDATAVAVSSVAPAYSLATVLGTIFILEGIAYKAPSMVIVSFVPILFIAYAYFHLNRRNPNCGASYSWLAQVFHPSAGWFNGFIQVGISVIFCVQAPIVAATYSLTFLNAVGLISGATVTNNWWLTWIALFWLALITTFCIVGIRWTTNFQWVLVIIEYLVVIVFSVGGIIKVAVSNNPHYQTFSASWLNPVGIHNFSSLATAVAAGTFLFWGWDTAVNLNEETKNPGRTPGRAAIISMWLLLVVFLLNFVAAQMLLTPAQLSNSSDLLFTFGVAFAGKWAGYIMIFAVLSSTVATTQTTLLPAARITYSMSRDRVFPRVFADVHPRYRTPALGTMILGAIAGAGVLFVLHNSSGSNIISTFTNNVGALVAFYYGITGIACAWAFRRAWRERTSFTLTGIVLPLLSGLALLAVLGWDIYSNGWSGMKWDIILLIAAAVLTPIVWVTKKRLPFFQQPMVSYQSIDETPEAQPLAA
jgi:amino acid transporter